MHGRRGHWVAVALATLLLLSPPTGWSQPLGDYQQEKGQAQAELLGIEQEEVAVLQELFRLNRSLQELRTEIAALAEQHAGVQADLDRLAADQVRLRADYSRRQRIFGQRLRFYYEEGFVGLLDLVLAARDFTDLLDRLYLMDFVLRADAGLLASLRALGRALAEQEVQLEQRRLQLADVGRQLTAREAELSGGIQEREARLASLRERRGTVETALVRLESVWLDQARPVLLSFGQAVHTLTLRGAELPAQVIPQILRARLQVVVSEAALNLFLGQDPALAQLQATLGAQEVTLTGAFSNVPLELAGRFILANESTLRFVPHNVRFFGVDLPDAMAQELVGSGALDLNLAEFLAGRKLQELRVEQGRLLIWASLT